MTTRTKIRIELTTAQAEQVQRVTGRPASVLEFSAEGLVAPAGVQWEPLKAPTGKGLC